MVAMTRAHMADPQIVNKLMRGEEDRIRPCVGASHCMWKKVACIHNPATGREAMLPQIVERVGTRPGRKVVVVGGGPGGLEAARVAAERGHKVVLFEAASRLGGQLLLAVQGDVAQGSHRHRRLARRRARAARRRRPPQHLRRAPTRCWPSSPTS